MFVLVSDFYCQGHSEDMQLLNSTKLVQYLASVYYLFFSSYSQASFLCESPSNRMSWFIFSLPFAMWKAGVLTF